jgi:hypothetical protein
MNILNSKFITISTLFICLTSLSHAVDFSEYKKIANETLTQVKNGNVTNIDQLIIMQGKLISIGKTATRRYGATNPKAAKMMRYIVAEADSMKTMSLSQIQTLWHKKEFLRSKGIPDALLAEQSKTGNYMDTVVHPATTYILLSNFKITKDKKLLNQVVGELEEVLHHIDSI